MLLPDERLNVSRSFVLGDTPSLLSRDVPNDDSSESSITVIIKLSY